MRLLSLSNPTMILALVLGILMGYLLFFEIPGKKTREEAEDKATRLLDFGTDEIQGLTLRHPGENLSLAKTDSGSWVITQPVQTETDPREIETFLKTLSDLHFSRMVGESGGNPDEFGLLHPNLEVSIELPGKTERFRLGDDAPVGNLVFMDRESDGRVVTVEKWVLGSLTRTVFDLRKKDILPFNVEGVEGVRLTFPGRDIVLEKTGDGWIIEKPVKDKVDPEAIQKLLTLLRDLRAESFIDPGPDYDRTRKELVSPGAEVTLREGASETLIRFFKSSEKDRAYVLTEEGQPVFLVRQASMDDIKTELFHYQDKRLLWFDSSAVRRITVQGPQEKYELLRSDGKWSLKGEAGEVRQNLADRLLARIEELRAFEPADSSSRNRMSSGLKSPGHILHLYSDGPDPFETLKIGNEWKGMLYTRGRAALGEVMISRDFLDEIPRKTELLEAPEAAPPADPPPPPPG